MIRIFKSVEDVIRPVDSACEGCWIALTDPTATEVFEISQRHEIDVDHLRAALDEEERSRIEVEDNYTLILVDIPVIANRSFKNIAQKIIPAMQIPRIIPRIRSRGLLI